MTRRVGPEEPPDDAPLFAVCEVIKTTRYAPISIDLREAARVLERSSTYRDAVAGYLMARRNQWVSGLDLAKIGGAYAWRTRVSNCRTELGMTIENRVRTLESGVKVSEYRLVVDVPPTHTSPSDLRPTENPLS